MYVPCIDIDVSRATWMEGDGRVADCGGHRHHATGNVLVLHVKGLIHAAVRWIGCLLLPHTPHASFTHASDLCHVKGFAAATRDDRPSLYAEFSLERLIQLLFGRACNVDG